MTQERGRGRVRGRVRGRGQKFLKLDIEAPPIGELNKCINLGNTQ